MKIAISLLILCLIAVFGELALADSPNEDGWYADNGDQTRVYRMHKPQVEPGITYPLVLLLHGYLDTATRLQRLWEGLPGADQSFLVLPQAPPTKRGERTVSTWDKSRDEKTLRDLVLRLAKNHPVDKEKIYVVGAGSGALVAIELVNKNPRMFSKLGMIAGGQVRDPAKMPGFKDLRVFMLGGQFDILFSAKRIESMSRIMKSAGAKSVDWEVVPKTNNLTVISHSAIVSQWLFGD